MFEGISYPVIVCSIGKQKVKNPTTQYPIWLGNLKHMLVTSGQDQSWHTYSYHVFKWPIAHPNSKMCCRQSVVAGNDCV